MGIRTSSYLGQFLLSLAYSTICGSGSSVETRKARMILEFVNDARSFKSSANLRYSSIEGLPLTILPAEVPISESMWKRFAMPPNFESGRVKLFIGFDLAFGL